MDINTAYEHYQSCPTAETITELFRSCRAYAYGLAKAYHLRDADDAVAEAVASAWANLDRYEPRPGGSFRSWFRTIIRNRLLNELRTGYRVTTEYTDRTVFDAGYRGYSQAGFVETLVRMLPPDSVEQQLCEAILDGDTVIVAASRVGLSGSAARKRLRRLAMTLDKK
jgi:RNA polymerase sigma factor (sigma-70 family)